MNFKRRSIAVISALSISLAAVSLPAWADERQDLVNQQEQNSGKMKEIRSSLEGIDVDLQDAFLALEKTRAELPDAEAELASAQRELAVAERQAQANAALLSSAQNELTGITGELSDSSDEASKTRQTLAEIARATYRGETMPSAIDLVVGSASAEEFTNAYRVNAAVTRTQSAALTELSQSVARSKNRQSRQQAVEKRVTELKAESDAIVVTRDKARGEAESRKTDLVKLESSITAQTQDLEKRKQDFESSLAEIESQQQATSARIAAIDEENRRAEEERRRQQAAAAAANTPAPAPASTGSGWLNPPIPHPLIVTSPWGMRVYPLGNYTAMHYGVDLASACGNPQYAAADGTITNIVYHPLGGNMIYVNHGYRDGASWVTRHLHMSVVSVSVGQHVSQGQVVGLTGATGRVTGCHAHFEVWKNGVTLNPMTLPGF
ncbi:M23 family metallopeptidase [Arcanobacterium phocae]|uniref:M23 family metallopeptidase n=1 Tax=Arcanobacterium phocae TaxID=131112 RepID=UPI001C0EE372|nr:M23 family metallopeptidase [Arcanobacterium phocae]